MEASITLKKVGKLIGNKTVLAGLTFGIEKGSVVAIIGDNDAGKSTLLHVLAGFENPEYGSVFIHGLDSIKRRSEIRRMIGYVPLEVDFDPWLTLEQNIRFIGLLYGINDQTILARIAKYSKALGITEFLTKPVMNISMGMLKKGMIVRALIHDPSILIMDEPTAFMDTQSSRMTWELIMLWGKQKTIVYTSQSLSEAEQHHDRILILHEGKVILEGSLEKLLESTLDFHQFRIEFEELTDDLFKQLSLIPAVLKSSRSDNIFHFYGRSKKALFQVLNQSKEVNMKDITINKLGLQDLMDSNFARKGLD